MEHSEQQVVAAVTPGDLLREARERLGYSPREMADRLNWLPGYVKAVEENHFDELRGDAFVRGYLRAYARQVGLAEDDIVAAYDAQRPAAEDSDSGQQGASTAGPGAGPGRTIFIGIVVALLVVAGLWWSQEQSAQQPARPAAVPVETVIEAPSVSLAETRPREEAAPIEQSVYSVTIQIAEADSGQSEVADATDEPSTGRLADTENGEPAQALAEEPDLEVPAIDSELPLLEFSFDGDCWVEVRDGNEELIYADLRTAGDELSLNGLPPFNIRLGDATVVELRFQGEPFPITTRPGRVLAKFSVGEP